jgi:hypothetical protein
MEHLDTGYAFGLSLCLAVNTFILAAEKIEIIYVSKDPDAVQQSRNTLLIEILPRLVCFMVASVIAGIGTEWSLEQDDDDNQIDGTVKTLSLRSVSLCLLASHFFSTVVPLIGYLSKFLPVNPIPWHYQVCGRDNAVEFYNIPKICFFFFFFFFFCASHTLYTKSSFAQNTYVVCFPLKQQQQQQQRIC